MYTISVMLWLVTVLQTARRDKVFCFLPLWSSGTVEKWAVQVRMTRGWWFWIFLGLLWVLPISRTLGQPSHVAIATANHYYKLWYHLISCKGGFCPWVIVMLLELQTTPERWQIGGTETKWKRPFWQDIGVKGIWQHPLVRSSVKKKWAMPNWSSSSSVGGTFLR